MDKILDGKIVSEKIFENIKKEVSLLKDKPKLAVILVGNNPASQIYVKIKQKRALELGYESLDLRYPETISEEKLIKDTMTLRLNRKPFYPMHFDS